MCPVCKTDGRESTQGIALLTARIGGHGLEAGPLGTRAESGLRVSLASRARLGGLDGPANEFVAGKAPSHAFLGSPMFRAWLESDPGGGR